MPPSSPRLSALPTWRELSRSAGFLRRGLNVYPPYLGAGVRVTELSDDYRHARVELALRPWTRNYVGTQFGGSMTSMVDPLRARAADGSKVLHWCETEIKDTDGEVVARVRKQLYVRLKRKD